ncbi:transcriptional regulator with XRE-family HTH domain [Angulomicrobium tetraedrale]|uniref:Transcriptional regulator with XRE-family HTH domain n=2 Tax=Ancylobacter tetraedralis TaxID=217068 RepID=A0A839ZAQ3_9HYPH|nr:transcriptional regulator with XRE-family HTH domain [Ancylobacter tetraedralis]
MRLACRIRLEREARGWSLADLAARAGVSKAAISKIERAETSPSAATLVRLASAFDLSLAGLLLRTEGGERLARAADQPLWRDPASGYVRRQIFAQPDHPVELVEVVLPPGARVDLPAASYARLRQVLQVRQGELVLTEGSQRHELKAGDCLGFGPPADVIFANETDAPCRYLVALTRL